MAHKGTHPPESLEVIKADCKRGFSEYDNTEHGSLSVDWDGLYGEYRFSGGAESGDSEKLFKGLATRAAMKMLHGGHLERVGREPWKEWLSEMRSQRFGFGAPEISVEVLSRRELARRKKAGEPAPAVKGKLHHGPELDERMKEWLARHSMPTSPVGPQLRFEAGFQTCERVFKKSAEFCDVLSARPGGEPKATGSKVKAGRQRGADDWKPGKRGAAAANDSPVTSNDLSVGQRASLIRAKTVARLKREIDNVRPQIFGEEDCDRLREEIPSSLALKIAGQHPDLKRNLAYFETRQSVGLAKRFAARYHQKKESTIDTDWKRHRRTVLKVVSTRRRKSEKSPKIPR